MVFRSRLTATSRGPALTDAQGGPLSPEVYRPAAPRSLAAVHRDSSGWPLLVLLLRTFAPDWRGSTRRAQLRTTRGCVELSDSHLPDSESHVRVMFTGYHGELSQFARSVAPQAPTVLFGWSAGWRVCRASWWTSLHPGPSFEVGRQRRMPLALLQRFPVGPRERRRGARVGEGLGRGTRCGQHDHFDRDGSRQRGRPAPVRRLGPPTCPGP